MSAINTALILVIFDIEAEDVPGHTRGFIVPVDTNLKRANLEDEAVGHIDVPVTEDESEWMQGLIAAAAFEGWALDGEMVEDGSTLTFPIVEGAPMVKLSEAARILGVSVRAAESALRKAGVSSGYPRDAVKDLATKHVRRTPRSV